LTVVNKLSFVVYAIQFPDLSIYQALFVDHLFKPFPESITTLVPSVEIGLSGQPGHAHWATPLTFEQRNPTSRGRSYTGMSCAMCVVWVERNGWRVARQECPRGCFDHSRICSAAFWGAWMAGRGR
jgi:hypothetical protein